MPGQNQLIQIRQAFKIPESVVIRTLPVNKIFKSDIGKPSTKYSIDQTYNGDPELYRSSLGTPVYTNIEFLEGQWETSTKGVFKQFGPMRFEAVLLTVSQAKKIIKTEIQGRNGSVKEYIGLSDYEIQINGIITGDNGQHPADDISKLKKILDAPVAVGIASTYLQNLDITSLVIATYEFTQEAGGYAYQTFSITCSSDVPQELRLSNV